MISTIQSAVEFEPIAPLVPEVQGGSKEESLAFLMTKR
jgi:hypothetical protein